MINISDLRESDKGRKVLFLLGDLNGELGEIVSWNEERIMVKYRDELEPKAIFPVNLLFVKE
jgi:hypothetical protein